MIVKITPIEDHEVYSVNGHIIYLTTPYPNRMINIVSPLSEIEQKAFDIYERLVIANPRFKKHPKSTYRN